jgi:site-specific recombinase XerD
MNTRHDTDNTRDTLPAIVNSLSDVEIAYAGFLGRFHGNTFQLYRYHLGEYLKWCEGHGLHPLRDIKRVHIEFYVRHLLEEKHLKPSSIGTRMSPVKGFYKFAVIDEQILRNPAEYVALPKVTYEKVPLVPYRDLMLWLEVAKDTSPRHWALTTLLSGMALRISEAASLRVESYLPNIEQGQHILKFTQKGGGKAAMPVALPVLHALEAVRDGRTEGPLIPGRDGRQLTRSGASGLVETVNRRAMKAGMTRHINPHLLRKMAITELLESGATIREAQLLARHVDPRTTSQHYDLGRSNHYQHPTHIIAARLAA